MALYRESIVSGHRGVLTLIIMKMTIINHCVFGTLLVLLLAITGCASDTPSGTTSSDDSARLSALEAEVRALKLEARAREESFKEELAQIRKNLEGIRALIEVEKGRAKALDQPGGEPKTESDKLDEELDKKAKSFVSENLDRLLDITKKLLDKMEKELDEQTRKEAPAPDGDQI